MGISEATNRRLLADCGGICANPACAQELFEPLDDGRVATVAERAHIIARSDEGPRGATQLPANQRDAYENLVLLCANCHTVVDADPDRYLTPLLLEWKHSHREKVRCGLIYEAYSDRSALTHEIRRLLRQNRAIHRTYGPESHDSHKSFDGAERWRQESIRVIVPNNNRILGLLRRSEQLLTSVERDLMEEFAVHAEGFAFNQISGDKNGAVPRFPEAMNTLFEAETDA